MSYSLDIPSGAVINHNANGSVRITLPITSGQLPQWCIVDKQDSQSVQQFREESGEVRYPDEKHSGQRKSHKRHRNIEKPNETPEKS